MPKYEVIRGRVYARPGMVLETDDDVFVRRFSTNLKKLPAQDPEFEDFLGESEKSQMEAKIEILESKLDYLIKENKTLSGDEPTYSPEDVPVLDGFPAKDILNEHGHTTYADISKLSYEELTDIPGIGNVTANQIMHRIQVWQQTE